MVICKDFGWQMKNEPSIWYMTKLCMFFCLAPSIICQTHVDKMSSRNFSYPKYTKFILFNVSHLIVKNRSESPITFLEVSFMNFSLTKELTKLRYCLYMI